MVISQSDEDTEYLRSLWHKCMKEVIGRQIVKPKEGEAQRLKRYFTGKPCSQGHLSERLLSNRLCCECVRLKAKLRPKERRQKYKSTPEWRSRNKKRLLQYHAEWRKRNRHLVSTYYRNRRARKKASFGTHSAEQIKSLLAKQCGNCANCFRRLNGKYHADHVVPLVKGGGNDIANIQLLCPNCNCRKHAKDPFQWAREQGRLL